MKTVVPAQVTTVEDRLTDSFTVRQFAILMMPFMVSILVIIGLPPYSVITWWKWVVIGLVSVLMAPLVIRIKDKIVLDWLIIYVRYLGRPKYYVYDKNNSYLRNVALQTIEEQVEEVVQEKRDLLKVKTISEKEKLRLRQRIEQGEITLEYKVNRKGQLDVVATEVQ